MSDYTDKLKLASKVDVQFDAGERDRMITMLRAFIAQCEAILCKPLLAGRYGKRRRQRSEGVAKYRHERRQDARWELMSLRAQLANTTREETCGQDESYR